MKPTLTLIFGLLYFLAQGQCPTDITYISSNEDVLNFVKKYPNCTELDTSLVIGPNKDINKTRTTDISALKRITKINGSLMVRGNPKLESLNGLQNITHITGDLTIQSASPLKAEIWSSKLARCDGHFTLRKAPRNDKTIILFPDLIKIGGGLDFSRQVEGHVVFPSLWKIGGSLIMYCQYVLMPKDEFGQLEKIGQTLSFSFSYLTKDLEFFPKLKSLNRLHLSGKTDKNIYIGRLNTCKSMDIYLPLGKRFYGLAELDSIDYLTIRNVDETNINSFQSLVFANSLEMYFSKKASPEISFPKTLKVKSFSGNTDRAAHVLKRLKSVRGYLGLIDLDQEGLEILNGLELKVDRFELNKCRVDTLRGLDKWKVNIFRFSSSLHTTHIGSLFADQNELEKLSIIGNPYLAEISMNFLPFKQNGVCEMYNNNALNLCKQVWVCALRKSDCYFKPEFNHPDCTFKMLKEKCTN